MVSPASRTLGTSLLALWISCAAQPASANLRAPRRAPHDGSSALYPVRGAEVLRELLRFACRQDRCDVTALYTVRSEQAQELELSFIVPGQQTVQVKVGGDAHDSQVITSEALDPRELESLSIDSRSDAPQLHKAKFRAALRAGEQTIEVRYKQRGDGVEHDYGYFSEGSFVYQLRYELWPLKEWQLAPGFTLELQVELTRERQPSLWKRWFGRVDTIACHSERYVRIGPRAPRNERVVQWRVTLPAAQLPDRLICKLGRENQVDLPD